MKRIWLWLWLLLLFCPGPALAQSSTAGEQANCNASFIGDCPSEGTFTTSSDGFAAPVGALGSSVLEGMLVALLIAGGIGSRLYRHAAEGAVKSSRCVSFEQPQSRGQSNAKREPLAPGGPGR